MSLGALVLTLDGCAKIFDLSPYDVLPPDGLRGLTALNLERARGALEGHTGPLTVAFTSDPHFHYGDLADVVGHMGGDRSIQLVMVAGDLTDQGLIGEFEWFARGMMGLDVPWFAVIGNHDHLGNGRAIYERMFGPGNMVLDLAGHRFILFDNTVWESDAPPDLDWLEAALADAGDRVPIVVAHIPPATDQLAGGIGERMHRLMADASVPIFIHGHQHVFLEYQPYHDGPRYLCVPWPRDGAYAKVTFEGRSFTTERIAL